MLVASHIVPWSKDEKNRLNLHNGLCLNLLHDKAFDRGLITITEDYKIKLSSAIIDYKDDEAIEKFFMPYNDHSIFLPKKFLPDKYFLRYHYENIFIKN